MEKYKYNWWHGAVFYQIYPRSFLDTGGNGVGDLPGITEKLDYVAELGVDGIWISPFFKSPMKDYGYDVSDFRDVDPLFGTLDDFHALLEKAHNLNLRVIIDKVLSHTSDQHAWFQDPDKKDWYVWADAKEDGSPPNNWVSVFGGSAWTWDERYNQYYMHNFLKEQPDLNYHNPVVQDVMLDECRFWLDMGVDGFRLDTVNFYFHDLQLRDNPPRPSHMPSATQFEGDDPYNDVLHLYDKSQPENLVFIERLRRLLNEYGAFSLGEISDDYDMERAHEYTKPGRLHTTYTKDLMIGRQKELTASFISSEVERFFSIGEDGYPAWAFSNHDVVRVASRWYREFEHDPRLSKLIMVLLTTLQGTIFIYQGEELGLPEAQIAYEDLQDPWGIHLWPEWQGRDGCRTPMPWDENRPENSWLPIPDTHIPLNVKAQLADRDSVLNLTRYFLQERKKYPALLYGAIEFEDAGDNKILVFTRRYEEQAVQMIFNLSEEDKTFEGIALTPYEWRMRALA